MQEVEQWYGGGGRRRELTRHTWACRLPVLYGDGDQSVDLITAAINGRHLSAPADVKPSQPHRRFDQRDPVPYEPAATSYTVPEVYQTSGPCYFSSTFFNNVLACPTCRIADPLTAETTTKFTDPRKCFNSSFFSYTIVHILISNWPL